MEARSLQFIRSEFADGARDVAGNRLVNAQATFRSVLRALLVVVLTSDEEAKQVGDPDTMVRSSVASLTMLL